MAEGKKTEFGTGRVKRASENPPVSKGSGTIALTTPALGTPAPDDELAASPKAKTSYLADAPDPLLGATIAGRYKIIKKLGEGGMGAVYLALHMVLEKQVALKMLHGEFARKSDLVERFMQEAKAASRIRHENVIDISDFGATPDGMVFFAMELLHGHDLHDEITRAKLNGNLLPWSRTKQIFLQICAALSAAHARGIVHRDLKPENVYLVEFLGDPDFVKLLDFGIAKVTDVSGNEEGARKLTKTGMLFGTPEYMSPEQARGDKVDHRVDIYAMGCILFQLVSNRVPFQAENFMGVLSQHLTEEPPQIAPEVFDQIGAPRALTDVIDKALTKDRDQRYQTIDELAAAVRTASGDPALADKSSKMRAASVPSPAETTRQRPPTARVEPHSRDAAASAAISASRSRTQWTGNLSVPEGPVEELAAPRKSKLPLLIGGIVLAAAAVGVGVIVTGKKETTAAPPPVAVGSAQGSAAVPPPPPQPDPLPVMAEIAFDSNPKNALVVDATDPSITYGKTPTTFSLPGSQNPRRFKFVLKGYGDSTVELVPNRSKIEFKQELVKGATTGDVVTRVPDPNKKPDDAAATDVPPLKPDPAGSAAVKPATKPDPVATVKPDPAAGSAAPKPDPAASSAAPKPDPAAGSAAPKPDPVVKPKDEDCPDDGLPCLKVSPFGDKK